MKPQMKLHITRTNNNPVYNAVPHFKEVQIEYMPLVTRNCQIDN